MDLVESNMYFFWLGFADGVVESVGSRTGTYCGCLAAKMEPTKAFGSVVTNLESSMGRLGLPRAHPFN